MQENGANAAMVLDTHTQMPRFIGAEPQMDNDQQTRAVEAVRSCLTAAGLRVWRTTRFGNNTGTALWLASGPVVTIRDDGEIRVQGRHAESAKAALEDARIGVVD